MATQSPSCSIEILHSLEHSRYADVGRSADVAPVFCMLSTSGTLWVDSVCMSLRNSSAIGGWNKTVRFIWRSCHINCRCIVCHTNRMQQSVPMLTQVVHAVVGKFPFPGSCLYTDVLTLSRQMECISQLCRIVLRLEES